MNVSKIEAGKKIIAILSEANELKESVIGTLSLYCLNLLFQWESINLLRCHDKFSYKDFLRVIKQPCVNELTNNFKKNFKIFFPELL